MTAAVAARIRTTPGEIHTALAGPVPSDDAGLVRLATDLDDLEAAVDDTRGHDMSDDPHDKLIGLRAEVGKAVVGQDAAVTGLLVGLLCRGHVLIEGVPGTAKTLLVRALAAALDLRHDPHPVHSRPHARRRHRLIDLRRADEQLRLP